jgi:hypothetical protein
VPPRVEQHVRDRVTRLARRPDDPLVVPILEHRTAAAEDPVRSPGESRPEGLCAAPERIRVVGLDEEVRVDRLHRVVGDAEVGATDHLTERSLELPHESDRAERRNVRANADREVDGVARRERLAGAMPDLRSSARRPTCARTPTSPSPDRSEVESKLTFVSPSHRLLIAAVFSNGVNRVCMNGMCMNGHRRVGRSSDRRLTIARQRLGGLPAEIRSARETPRLDEQE